ncbi:MAG TPA: T9SS type A sorting domain-containing protein [Candidatus Latescibacteria bacterium]|nr:T9SS type A sorting domain-containing protein [Candidatus Latescibacterota bacterium]
MRLLSIVCFSLLMAGTISGAPDVSASVQHWRVLALRVQFPEEDPDNRTTTGNGTFDLRDFSDPEVQSSYKHPYDTPPHNRQYFQWHLQALANYYHRVSEGRVEITFEVFPQEPDSSYRLVRSMASYGNGRTRDEINFKLCELLRDAISLADSVEGDGLDFSHYQSFLVIHAGMGKEMGLINDIPSAYLTEEDLVRYLGGPIRVDNGQHTVSDGLIVPEAASRDGTVGLNGLLAKLFGYQLGLPGLSNFRDNLPAAGGWSLMDTGSMSIGPGELMGFVPTHPIAWSKVQLGWIQPVEVMRDTTLRIVATDVDSDLPKAVKIPINSSEYFLLENRQVRYTQDQMPEVEFSIGDSAGVWLSVDHYDSFIPGSGILIWHIDESLIHDKWTTGQINDDPLHRGVDLEEADGYEDIGNYYTISSPRVDQINGSPDDPFYVGNGTEFSSITIPASKSYSGIDTGLKVVVKDPPADTMTVEILWDLNLSGWPQGTSSPMGKNSPIPGDVIGDGDPEIVAISTDGRVYVWATNGDLLWSVDTADTVSVSPTLIDLDADGKLEVLTVGEKGITAWKPPASIPLFNVGVGSLPTTPAVISNAEGRLVVVGTADGRLYAIDLNQRGILWEKTLAEGESRVVGLAVTEMEPDGSPDIVASLHDGRIFRIGEGEPILLFDMDEEIAGPPVTGDLDLDGQSEIIAVSVEGKVVVLYPDGQLEQGFPIFLGDQSRASPVLGDIDDDGYLEIVIPGQGNLHAIKSNGVPVVGFPVRLPFGDGDGLVVSSPILADVDGGPYLEIFVGTSGEKVYGYDGTGRMLPGFPVAAVGSVTSSPLLLSLGSRVVLGAVTQEGWVHIWDLARIRPSFTGTRIIWGMEGADPGHTGSYPGPLLPSGPTGSRELLPAGSLYCYPNPIDTDSARFRFYLGEQAMVRIRVFNLAGELVDELVKPKAGTQARSDNEIVWDVSRFESGTYICQVEAEGDSTKVTRVLKAAICK